MRVSTLGNSASAPWLEKKNIPKGFSYPYSCNACNEAAEITACVQASKIMKTFNRLGSFLW